MIIVKQTTQKRADGEAEPTVEVPGEDWSSVGKHFGEYTSHLYLPQPGGIRWEQTHPLQFLEMEVIDGGGCRTETCDYRG